MPDLAAFRALSARLGADPLQVQGPGGNTSFKDGGTMWIKASGTELADAETDDIFVAVDVAKARTEANGAGDGTCRAAVLDPSRTLRPSIETTFHAILDWPVVVHTHSVVTLAHVITEEGCRAADDKLSDLPAVRVPYAKPGLPLTRRIAEAITPQTRVILLENHGLICAGPSVDAVADLIADVERRLSLPRLHQETSGTGTPPDGFEWSSASWMAHAPDVADHVTAGSFYPDHVVFLGPALPTGPQNDAPAVLIPGQGVALRRGASASQSAMLDCLSNVFSRVPQSWSPRPIGAAAEAELLNWDAEKYRQALAARA